MDELDRLVDEARADEAAAARTRERWLRQQAQEDATFAGSVLDLAEGGRPVAVTTCTGRTHHGTVRLVGDGCVVLRSGGRLVHLALHGVVAVVGDPVAPSGPATGDRPPASSASLLDLLVDLAAERPEVQVEVIGTPQPLAGRLLAVGVDVLTVALTGEPARTCLVPAQSVVSVSTFESG